MQRYDYLKELAATIGDALVVVAHAAREWNAVRPSNGNFRIRTLGLTSSTALGVALGLPHRKVIAIDGDGAFLMNLCGLPTIARQRPANLIHVLFDNERYETAGGAATATSSGTDAVGLARSAGYKNAVWVHGLEDFCREFSKAQKRNELSFIAAKVDPGSPGSLTFPIDEVENKYRFIRHIEAMEQKEIIPVADHSVNTANLSRTLIPKGTSMTVREHTEILVAGLKSAGIDFVASLPDQKFSAVVEELDRSESFTHVPLCREEEGVAICAGAYLTGKKTAMIVQNGGLLNSCNVLATMSLQHEIPNLLLVYYAGDIGDRGFATLGSVTEPVLQGLGIRSYVLRDIREAEDTLVNAQILASDARKPVAVLITKSILGVNPTAS